MRMLRIICLPCLVTISLCSLPRAMGQDLETAMEALERAVTFYRDNVSIQGGSVYRVSEDLSKREGEEKVGPREVWIEPPGTPAVGMAYLRGWQLTGLPVYRDAMLEVADALIRGQLESGGWGVNIEFDPLLRPKYAYRVDHRTTLGKRRNRTTFDDNKSQSSLEFLMLVDRELQFQNPSIHEAVLYALESFTRAQYPNGAWPQQYTEFPDPAEYPVVKAKFPGSWNREYERISYSRFYTLNDNTICDLIELMLLAHAVYDDDNWLASAKKGGDFLLLAQLPEPQPGWAQQYNINMEPEWARKFEPPAITGGESQSVIQTLMTLYDRTGDEKYMKPIPRALEFYRSLELEDGKLARFYEMGSNKPLYFTREYELVYRDDDLPTHYGFKVSSKLDRLQRNYERFRERGPSETFEISSSRSPRMSDSLSKKASGVIRSLDKRGAWVEPGELRNFDGDEQVDRVIDTRTYIENISTLADFISAAQQK